MGSRSSQGIDLIVFFCIAHWPQLQTTRSFRRFAESMDDLQGNQHDTFEEARPSVMAGVD